MHCLSNLHNFIKTYGETKDVEWKKNISTLMHAYEPVNNFNVALPYVHRNVAATGDIRLGGGRRTSHP